MIYRFDFIPSGIMSWFIVRTHRYIVDSHHWREGVLLAYGQQDRNKSYPSRIVPARQGSTTP
jgi:hypothetical protein